MSGDSLAGNRSLHQPSEQVLHLGCFRVLGFDYGFQPSHDFIRITFAADQPFDRFTVERAPAAPLFDLTTYGAAQSDPIALAAADVTAPIVLDKHPAMREGRPELAHTINDEASPDVAPITVSEGQVVHLHIVNNTDEFHPMHLHGHVMSVLARNGQAIQGSPVHLDSVLVGPRETWDVAFSADNPGIWMFHCHVLLHAGMGMMATINYTGVSTPFEMGTRSGNKPE